MKTLRSCLVAALAACCVVAMPRITYGAAKIVIVNANSGSEGLNDPTAATPVGGNAGITVGQQRMIALKYAAAIWGTALNGTITISIQSQFTGLTCSTTSVVLGQAGPAYADTSGPIPNVLYPGAVANQIVGQDLGHGTPAIVAQFNSGIGTANCQGTGWYYGFDENTGPGQFDLAEVVLHEFAHGLGFLTFTNGETGQEFVPQGQTQSIQDVWEFMMFDLTAQTHWNRMSAADRQASGRGIPRDRRSIRTPGRKAGRARTLRPCPERSVDSRS